MYVHCTYYLQLHRYTTNKRKHMEKVFKEKGNELRKAREKEIRYFSMEKDYNVFKIYEFFVPFSFDFIYIFLKISNHIFPKKFLP